MAKITNPETLQAQKELLQHIAMMTATLRALSLAIKRDYRSGAMRLAHEGYQQWVDLVNDADDYRTMPATKKEGA